MPPDRIMRSAIIDAIAYSNMMAEINAMIEEDDLEVLMLD